MKQFPNSLAIKLTRCPNIPESPPYELPFVHPSRFSNNLAKEKAIDMIIETYARGYSIDDF